jgi:hypothetical protein
MQQEQGREVLLKEYVEGMMTGVRSCTRSKQRSIPGAVILF